MSNPTSPPRRWFPRSWLRFSLRSMLIAVTIFAVWLGWELSYIRERQAWIRENTSVVIIYAVRFPSDPTWRGAHIPWWRRWMGDEAVVDFIFPEQWKHEKIDQALHLFPEVMEYRQRSTGGAVCSYIKQPGPPHKKWALVED